ncbi:MAG: DUF1501 domain-containing protein [Pirellulaceae bacterium]
MKRGYVQGASDAQAAFVDEHPVRPDDLAATMHHLLGIDPYVAVHDRDDRPLMISGNPVPDGMA